MGVGYFVATNKEITLAAWTSPEFDALLWKLWQEKRVLNGVNVSTILHRAAKLWHCIHPLILTYLADSIAAPGVKISLRAQHVGNALYGLQSLGDSAEVREVLAALAPKVRECGEGLGAQAVGNALYGLKSLGDSAEAREVLAALAPKVRWTAFCFWVLFCVSVRIERSR